MPELPIHDALPRLREALLGRNCAVLVAPPGAGKTTVTPLALLDSPWVGGRKLIVLEPRRLAARAAASRMAFCLNESVGETVGYRVRLDTRVSPRTRIEVVTDGVFTRMILDDPGLDGIAGILFDEFHERSLDADLGLAFARDSQMVLREDLRLLVMSATLDGARIAERLGNAPIIESFGRTYDVATRYLGRDPARGLEAHVVRAIVQALAAYEGDMLVFLPGQGEIGRVQRHLFEVAGDRGLLIVPLHGGLDAAEQDRAISPGPLETRKVVLATSIAQTSLTLSGVRVVIDCGLARVPRFDPGAELTRLVTVPVSQASADQRRGRAGRTATGHCLRLWDEAQTRALPAFDRPEILDTDLSRLLLDLARWGAGDGSNLTFLDRPPRRAMDQARAVLMSLGAIDGDGVLTRHGSRIAALPLPPRLAHMILSAAPVGGALRAARLAALLTERGLGGRETDVANRMAAFDRDNSPRARAASAQAARWSDFAIRETKLSPEASAPLDYGVLIASAFPERVAKARDDPGQFKMTSGRGAFVDPADPLARETWLAIAELGGGGVRDRVLLAARLDAGGLDEFSTRITHEDRLVVGPSGIFRVSRIQRFGALVVRERILTDATPSIFEEALLGEVRRRGLGALGWGADSLALRARLVFAQARDAAWPDLSDRVLLDRLDLWLRPALAGLRSLAAISDTALEHALRTQIPWTLQMRLDADAPTHWTAPTGLRLKIDYAATADPRVAVRVQEIFGLTVHPTIGRGTTLTLALLSPAGRELQVTRDLPGFWAGSWRDVVKEMRGRYPKHHWPDDPTAAAATTRAKPRGASRV